VADMYAQVQPSLPPGEFGLVSPTMNLVKAYPPGTLQPVPEGVPYPWAPGDQPRPMAPRPTCALPLAAAGYRELYPANAPQPAVVDIIEVWWGNRASRYVDPARGTPSAGDQVMVSCPSCLWNIGPIMSGIVRR
jgi:hypothetical protein